MNIRIQEDVYERVVCRTDDKVHDICRDVCKKYDIDSEGMRYMEAYMNDIKRDVLYDMCRFDDDEYNEGYMMYIKSTKTNEIRRDMRDGRKEVQFSHIPCIDSNSIKIVNNNSNLSSEKVEDRLYNRRNEKSSKHYDISNRLEELHTSQCTFKPHIDDISSQIIDIKRRRSKDKHNVFTSLYNDAFKSV